MFNKKILIGLVIAAVVTVIVSLFFSFQDTNVSEILNMVGMGLIAIAYVGYTANLKRKRAERTGKTVSIFKFFKEDKASLSIGIALLLFAAKLILKWYGVGENITGAIHYIALAFLMLTSYFGTKKMQNDIEPNS